MALKAKVVKLPKSKSPDFGSTKDWSLRLHQTLVWYKDQPFYVRDVKSKDTPKTAELRRAYRAAVDTYQNAASEAEHIKGREIARRLDRELKAYMKSAKASSVAKGQIFPLKADGKEVDIGKNNSSHSVTSLDLRLRPMGFYNRNLEDSRIATYVSRLARQQSRHGLSSSNTLASSVGRGRYADFHPADKEFLTSLYGIYPSLEECLDTLFPMEGTNSMAFCRKYAIQVDAVGHVVLFYRTKMVGMSSDEGKTFKLLGRHTYLKEDLTDTGVTIDS